MAISGTAPVDITCSGQNCSGTDAGNGNLRAGGGYGFDGWCLGATADPSCQKVAAIPGGLPVAEEGATYTLTALWVMCPAGTHANPATGLCENCDAGMYCPEGSTNNMTPCPSGYYCPVAAAPAACPASAASEETVASILGSDSLDDCYGWKSCNDGGVAGIIVCDDFNGVTGAYCTGTETCNTTCPGTDEHFYNGACASNTQACDSPEVGLVEENGVTFAGNATYLVIADPDGNRWDISACIANDVPFAGDEFKGAGTRDCKHTSGSGSAAVFDRECGGYIATSCYEGYYWDNNAANACVDAGIGYYSAANDIARTACADNGGTGTDGVNSASMDACFKNDIPYDDTTYCAGTDKCYWNAGTSAYDKDCAINAITSCVGGWYHNVVNNSVEEAPAGTYSPSPDIGATPCPAGTYNPDTGKSALSDCAACPLNNACLAGSVEIVCNEAERYERVDNGGIMTCERLSIPCNIENGTGMTNPGNETCRVSECNEGFFKSADGLRCDSCMPGQHMVGGVCAACPADSKVLSYKGECMIELCADGHHLANNACEANTETCIVQGGTGERTWTSEDGWGECVPAACDGADHHIEGGLCVANVKTCVIQNGEGSQEWQGDATTGQWGKCEPTSCIPGYTSDRGLTNDWNVPCGRCNNYVGSDGEQAVSSYSSECNIAVCMYQGEKYVIEGDECVPICETRSDETGSMRFDGTKCRTSCEAGYTEWQAGDLP